MTVTKRKRLLVEKGTAPGDLVQVDIGGPILKVAGNYNSRIRWHRDPTEVALLLAVCGLNDSPFFEWSLIFTMGSNTLGWVETKKVKPCP